MRVRMQSFIFSIRKKIMRLKGLKRSRQKGGLVACEHDHELRIVEPL